MGSLQNLPEYGMMRVENSRPHGGRREQTVAQSTKNIIRSGFIELLDQLCLQALYFGRFGIVSVQFCLLVFQIKL